MNAYEMAESTDDEDERRIATAMQGVPDEIKCRQIALFAKCDPAYGTGVENALELDSGTR